MDMFDSAFEKAIKEQDKTEAEKEYTSTMNMVETFQCYKKFIEEKLPKLILNMIKANKAKLKDKDTDMIYDINLLYIYPDNDNVANDAYRDLVMEFFHTYELIDERTPSYYLDENIIEIKASLNKLKNAYYTELQALPVREQEISEMVQSNGYTK